MCDDFDFDDAMYFGAAMGWAEEECLLEQESRRLERELFRDVYGKDEDEEECF